MSAPREEKKHARVSGGHGPRLAILIAFALILITGAAYLVVYADLFPSRYVAAMTAPSALAWPLTLDTAAYDARVLALAHVNVASTTFGISPADLMTMVGSSTLFAATASASTSVSIAGKLWPHAATYPEGGAILPFNRIVAYYGNFYSTGMGVLGEYPPSQVLAMLASTTAEWEAADPSTPVIPAIQYIAVVAQGSPGPDGKYRARMPADQIDQALSMANQIHGLLILDVQVGLSNVETEIPLLEPYLQMPNVELAIDPEFSMKDGAPPGTEIGTYDATDINWTADYLASLVREYHLPPKVLIVHRFTYDMVTNVQDITPLPEVEIVMDMDGWGSQAKKIGTYNAVIAPYPVEFTGIKLFYKADLKPPSTGMLTPEQVLSLTPAPSYIQYQ